jgi:hypothetical protein
MDPEVGRALMLAGVLPAGTDRYLALYLGNPAQTGVELTLTGYARVGHQDWTTSVPGVGQSARANASTIEFPTITQAGSADYWGIFDASVAGNLLRFGPVTDLLGAPTPVVFSGVGEEARFLIGTVVISVRDV